MRACSAVLLCWVLGNTTHTVTSLIILVFQPCTTSLSTSTSFFFFFNDPATTEIYPLSLHDALPICPSPPAAPSASPAPSRPRCRRREGRSEEHTSELQSHDNLVCRLLLGKNKTGRRQARHGPGGGRGECGRHPAGRR